MDELSKTRCRNIVSALAYFLLAALGGVFTVATILDTDFIPGVMLGIEILIGIAGIVLLILRKRDLTAIVFLMFATLFAYYTVTGGVRFSSVSYVLCWLFILFPLLVMATKEKKASSYFCVLFPYGIGAIAFAYFGGASIVTIIMHIIFALVALFTGIIYLAEKSKKPMALKIRSDEEVQFTRSGPCLGFYLLAVFCIVETVSILMGATTSEISTAMSITCGISLIITACLLFIFARMRFGALLVLLGGIALTLLPFASTMFPDNGRILWIIVGILFIIITILAWLRKRSVSAALMFILIGVFFLLTGLGVMIPVLNAVLLGLAGLLGIYLTLALLAKKPLPGV